jgi:hypothetical protein
MRNRKPTIRLNQEECEAMINLINGGDGDIEDYDIIITKNKKHTHIEIIGMTQTQYTNKTDLIAEKLSQRKGGRDDRQ